MEYKEKIDQILRERGLNRKKIAERLDLDYSGLTFTINKNQISLVLIKGLIKEFPDIDLNWLLKNNENSYLIDQDNLLAVAESEVEYNIVNPLVNIDKAILLLKESKRLLTQK